MRRRHEGDASRTPGPARARGRDGRARFGCRQPCRRRDRDRRRHRAAGGRAARSSPPGRHAGAQYGRVLLPRREEGAPAARAGEERSRARVGPSLDQVDRYGRLLRYLRRGSTNVNIALVREGAAAPYFYGGDTGRYADRLLSAAKAAKAARRGLWGACPGTVLDPTRAVETRQKDITPPRPLVPRAGCDPSYPTVCIPPYPPGPRLQRRARQALQGRRHRSARLRRRPRRHRLRDVIPTT